MKMFGLLSFLSFVFVFPFSSSVPDVYFYNNTDAYLNAPQIIRKYGYPSESHTVETADGYLLTMHRIPNSNYTAKRPIFLQHGILGQSVNFMMLQRTSLPFLLADLGYDVWLGNVRGNAVSRAHVSLFPNEAAFWNFSWHESGIYDISAEIDFICNHTKQEKIYYLGFSMGTTMFMVLMSTLPEYNQKIESAFLMGVVGYTKQLRSPLIRFVTLFEEIMLAAVKIFSNGEFLPDNRELKLALQILCVKNLYEADFCWYLLHLLLGYNPQDSHLDRLSVVLTHYPNGYSFKGFHHYAQLLHSGKFQQYDYGEKGNLLKYGTRSPPDYNLKAITAPMYFYIGPNDYLATVEDGDTLAKQLTSLKKLHVVKYHFFTHVDFMASPMAKKYVYDLIIQELKTQSNAIH